VSRLIATSKKKYYHGEFEKCKNKTRKMWHIINTLSNNKALVSCVPPKLRTDNGVVIRDPVAICELFNKFFANVGAILANKIKVNYQNSERYTLSHQNQNNQNKLSVFKRCDIRR
jgi:hypothetical protein